MKQFITFLILFISPIVLFAQNDNYFDIQMNTENGLIEGSYDTKSGIQKYFGIPFAKAPVGNLRWKAPQALENWTSVKMTKTFGPRPMQRIVFGDMSSRSAGISEDCLYLNVWTPTNRNTKNLPVLVYFYGGGNVAGDASEPRYDGEAMAQQGIVVVTCNYRLNIFGYLAHEELSKEAPYKASGNYGALDQLAALQWVQQNIKSFGGDPSKVTIAGESAGSVGVSTQMASPLAKNLIAGAIGESGAAIPPTMAPISLTDAEDNGADFLNKAGIKDIEELRSLSTQDIYEIYNGSNRFGFPLVIDGYFLPKSLIEIYNAQEQAQVPLLAGWNSAEIPGMAYMQGQNFSREAFITKTKLTYPDHFSEVLELHPHANLAEVERSATDLAADRFIAYSTWKWLDLHKNNSSQPVYRYLYSKLRPALLDKNLSAGLAGGTVKAETEAPKLKAMGAPHACEIEYAMGNLDRVKDFDWTSDDFKVSKTMLSYFANFIKTGNPNGENLPKWDAMDPKDTTPSYMIIDTESKQAKSNSEKRYQFHDRFYGNAN